MADVKITVRLEGPFKIEAPEGSVELVDHEGKKFELTGKTVFSLCRCGASTKKPYCDGSHKTVFAQTPPVAGASGDKPQV